MTDERYKSAYTESPFRQQAEKTLHELQIRQIELEIQNEALRQAQQAIQASRDHFQHLYDCAPFAYLTLNPDHFISEINLTAANLLGVDSQFLIGRHFPTLLADQSRDFWERYMLHIQQSGENQSCELQLRRSDDSLFHAKLDCLLLADTCQQPELRIALTDITQQKQAEQTHSDSRQLLAGIVESAMDAIICIDADYRIVLFNAAAGNMFGCITDQAIGTAIAAYIPVDFRTLCTAPAPADNTVHQSRELRVITGMRANGEAFPLEAGISEIGTDEQILYTLILRDVSARSHADSLLQAERHLQDQLSKVAASVPGVICSFRLAADGSTSMPYASQALESLYGLPPAAVADDFSPVFARVHPDDIEQINETINKSALSLEPWQATFRYQHPSKGEIWIEGHSMPMLEQDGGILWHGYLQDITARKQAETVYRDQDKELQLIIDATPALIAYLDVNFKYLRVNANYGLWFGIAPEHVIGRTVQEIMGNAAWGIVRPYLERTLAGEQVSFDQQIPYGEAKPRWVHATYIPNTDAAGTLKGIVVHVIDIEERKLSEQKISLLNQRLQRRLQEMQVIFNTVPIGLSIADDNSGQHIRGNLANEQMLGLPPTAELSLSNENPPPITVLLNGLPLAADDLPIQRACRGEVVSDERLDIVRTDGKVITVVSNASPLLDDAGRPRGAVGAFLDITPLKVADDALRRSEAFVRCILNSLPAHVAVLDELGVVTTVNAPWDSFAIENGGSPSQLSEGANYLEVCRRSAATGDRDAHKALAGLEALIAGHQQEFMLEYPCHTKLGELWFMMHAKRITQGLQGMIITHVDITELKRTHAELQHTETRLALIIGEVNAGYWDWDLVSQTLFLSPEWKRQIGFDDQELLNQWEEWESRLHPDDRAMVLASTEDYLSGHLPTYELEFRLRHKNGSYRWIHARGSLLHDKSKRPYRLLGINFDITDYKLNKELSERRNKMEQSFRVSLATQTIAAIAHELNQPLAAISSYADVALRLYQSDKPDSQKLSHVLEACVQQAQRAGEVIRQLFSHLNKTEAISELIDINFLVHEACVFVKNDRTLSSFKLELDLAADLPRITVNALQIQKVLVNLICNALEAMQEQGKHAEILRIKTGRYPDDPDMALVTVCDSGKGLTDAIALKTLFQPFYSTKPAGLGMGLAISRALIQAHGGNMWAERNVGDGLTMLFILPFAK
ncbi:Two-component system sensor histidine kinase [Methylomonas albis]|uniref:histidine kinase n=1 Tax=Methylomonas albis TaxID=1854563 RepID=A0ABR9D3C8_9GAMM|nr:PAS domain S-box protein [Methylomonas albis]MBD9357629.1 PAS domain S-box protein [Methylomonas albis]CAD6880935.1 Two-component system sensor histidine kinase [Methylomonas albis]